MTTGLYFLKLELNYLKDSTFNTDLTDAQKWRYLQLYMLAKELNEGGAFIEHGKELRLVDIAWTLHLEVDQLQADLEAMQGIGLICENGHGPYLTRFVQEQETARTGAERQHDQRIRERSQVSNEPVTIPVTTRHIESESDIESDIESVSSHHLSQGIPPETTDDDLISTDQKTEICKHAGIPPKYSKSIISNHNGPITPADILAELSRNYSRKKVKNPGYITGMNLSKITPEKAAADWYDRTRWEENLPLALREKLPFAFKDGSDKSDTLLGLTMRKSKVEDKVSRFLGETS